MKTKSPHLQKAQIAAFASETMSHDGDFEFIVHNLGAISTGDPDSVQRVLQGSEYLHTEASIDGDRVTSSVERLPEGSSRRVATKKEFVDFLRDVGGSSHEPIKGREKILRAYDDFSDQISDLKRDLPEDRSDGTADFDDILLGSGSNSDVYKIVKDDAEYAVRIPKGGIIKPNVIDDHIAAAALAKGVHGLEQIVAASYEDGVTIAELMPGKELTKLTPTDIYGITDGQITEFVDTVITLHERGLGIDPKPSNIFYDPNEGFGIVDYHSSTKLSKNSADQDLAMQITFIAGSLRSLGFGQDSAGISLIDRTYYSQHLQLHVASRDLLMRYRSAVEDKLSVDNLSKTILEGIDNNLMLVEETITNYSNEEWVRERIEFETKKQQEKYSSAEKGLSLKLDIF